MVDPVTIGSIAGAAVGGGVALSKLLDVARSGIGAVARPWLTVRDARATAQADKLLAANAIEIEEMRRKALPPAPDLQQAPRSSELAKHADAEVVIDVDFEDVPPLAERTEERLTYQEAKRQLNVENVVREAAEELKDVADVSADPVDDDWTARFFGNVQDVSNEQMRKLWAKVLAGEVVRPGSFSLRTLEALKNLCQSEAALFAKIAGLASQNGAIFVTEYATTVLNIEATLLMEQAGLVTSGPGLGITMRFVRQGDGCTFSHAYRDVVLIAKKATPVPELALSARTFTLVGRELAKVIPVQTDMRQVQAVIEKLCEKGFSAAAHRILKQTSEVTSFDLSPLDLSR